MTFDQFIHLFPQRKKNSPTDYHLLCPGHADNGTDPNKLSLHATLEGGLILLNCFAGCETEWALSRMDPPRTLADLFVGPPAPPRPAAPEPVPTLAAFAQLKHLSQAKLKEWGWQQNARGLVIPYRQRDDSPWRLRCRTSLRPGAGFTWDGQKDRPLIPYGRWRLDEAMEKGALWLVEGESDAVTAWTRGLPCLGIPGNLAVKALTTEDLVGIETLWIVQEPGAGGQAFVHKLRERLTEIGYAGRTSVVTLPAKDLSDLHVLQYATFWTAIKTAQSEAQDLTAWHAQEPTPLPPAEPGRPAGDPEAPPPAQPFAEGAGDLLARAFPPIEVYIQDVLTAEGSGFIGGEEKLGKTYYAITEAFALAMGTTLCNRFAVPQRRRVLFIEEEDSPRRTRLRLRAIARGHAYDPDAPAFQAELSQWARFAVWQGFTLDDPAWLARLEAELSAFPAAVVYLDVLRKLTVRDLNKAAEASPIFNTLDDLRRTYGCVFRVLHHYRKGQGQRLGRGSQEMGGSFVLAAWTEQAVYLEPIGRKGGGVSFDVQQKDGAAGQTLRLTWESEGPAHDPTWVRLVLVEMKPNQAASEALAEQVLQLLQTLPYEPSPHGSGVSIPTLVQTLKGTKGASPSGIKRALKILVENGSCEPNDSRGSKWRRYTCEPIEKPPLVPSNKTQENLI